MTADSKRVCADCGRWIELGEPHPMGDELPEVAGKWELTWEQDEDPSFWDADAAICDYCGQWDRPGSWWGRALVTH